MQNSDHNNMYQKLMGMLLRITHGKSPPLRGKRGHVGDGTSRKNSFTDFFQERWLLRKNC